MSKSVTKGADLSMPSHRKDANQNTRKVLDAAYRVFIQKGFSATIEEIAQEAGVGVGTVHRRFTNKQILAAAVVTDIFSAIKKKQLEIAGLKLRADKKLCLLLKEFATFHENYGNIHSIGLQLAAQGELGEEMKASMLFGLQGVVSGVIEQGQAEGIFRDGDPRLFETLILNMINPNLILKLKELMPVHEIQAYISDMLLLGLCRK